MDKEQKLILQKKLGARLQQLRESQKLALRELSYRCNLDHSKIGKIEKGRMNITLNTLFELSDALQVHPRDLFEFDVEQPVQVVAAAVAE
jgi:transcriptional regulator with XRE-family HTH domain